MNRRGRIPFVVPIGRDIAALPVPDASFDTVLYVEVLAHQQSAGDGRTGRTP